jgi:hypothetical protein
MVKRGLLMGVFDTFNNAGEYAAKNLETPFLIRQVDAPDVIFMPRRVNSALALPFL